jgi:hypothetical protein
LWSSNRWDLVVTAYVEQVRYQSYVRGEEGLTGGFA